MKKFAATFLAGSVVALGGVAIAGPMQQHVNLAAAHQHVKQAYEKISAAQRANEFDLGGHAAKAKGYLEQADRELREAAAAADKHHDKDHRR